MNRFNRPRLITFQDPAYLRHVEEMKLRRANQRAIKPPSQRDVFGGEVETLLRAWLAEHFALSDRRILEYEERKGRSWQRKYRELDAAIVDGHARAHVFEIKASRRAVALHRALRQLRETAAILKLAFPTVCLTVMVVDTGMPTPQERDELAAAPDAPEHLPQTLDDAIAEHADVRRVATLDVLTAFPPDVELVVLSLADLIALADGAPLSLDWEGDEVDDVATEAAQPSAPLYSSGADEAEESPFAAALRRATLDRSKR